MGPVVRIIKNWPWQYRLVISLLGREGLKKIYIVDLLCIVNMYAAVWVIYLFFFGGGGWLNMGKTTSQIP